MAMPDTMTTEKIDFRHRPIGLSTRVAMNGKQVAPIPTRLNTCTIRAH